MADENNVRPDEVSIHHNDELVEGPEVDEANYDNLPSLTDGEGEMQRPAESAGKAEWVKYCVKWGADKAYISGDTDHVKLTFNEDMQPVTEVETHPGLTKDQLMELATSLGG